MRLGVHARGGVRTRGTSTLPEITGDLSLIGGGDVVMSAGGQVLIDPGSAAAPGLADRTVPSQGIYMTGAILVANAPTVLVVASGTTAANFGVTHAVIGSSGQPVYLDGAVNFREDIPWALAATNPDGAPTGLAGASRIRLTAGAAATVTGLTGGADGRQIILENTSAFAVTLSAEDVLSLAANRFATSRVIAAGATLTLSYEAGAARWRLPT